jgi:outer membrane lipoprotein-sorting protein
MTCTSFLRAAAAFVAVFACASAASADSQPDDPAALLRESLLAPQTVSYVGQIETVRFSSNRAIATIVKIEHRAPGLTRRWYVAPEELYGDYIITRGHATYQYDTTNSKVTISHAPEIDDQVAASGNFEHVLENYRTLYDGTETVADRPTISIVLINKYTGERAMRAWIDRDTNLVLKKEEYHANGAIASQTRFEEIRYTGSIPNAIFSTNTPSNYTEVAGARLTSPSLLDLDRTIKDAGFSPYRPHDLPQGFILMGANVADLNGVRTLHLLYSDGLRSISLFENAANAAADFGTIRPKTTRFEDHPAEYIEDGPTTLLTWKEHGLSFALVGDQLLPELVEIARSVVP